MDTLSLSGATARFTHILLTGPPGIGKTTICKNFTSLMKRQGSYVLDGFYTEEVRVPNKGRVGFDIIPVRTPEIRTRLARKMNILKETQSTKYCVGNYCVFLDDFEKVVLPIFQNNAHVLLIDEIGKMETFSNKFKNEVTTMLLGEANKKICVVGTIPQIHKIPQQSLPFFQKLYTNNGSCKVVEVNCQNRDHLSQEIFQTVSQILMND